MNNIDVKVKHIDKTLIFRIIHIDNLKLYIENGLYSQNFAPEELRLRYVDIYNHDVHEKRGRTSVHNRPDTTIHDYVPFYFCPRSPMLLSVTSKSGVNKDDILHIVACAQDIHSNKEYDYVFTDCHAKLYQALWYDNISDLDKLCWSSINAKYWGKTVDPTGMKMHNKMAEFLVYQKLGWEMITEIGVPSQTTHDKVQKLLDNYKEENRRRVSIHKEWYY